MKNPSENIENQQGRAFAAMETAPDYPESMWPLLKIKIYNARKIVIATVSIGLVIGVIVSYILPVKYQSQITALPPQQRSGFSGIGQYTDLAAMAGISLPGNEEGSVDEILAILESRTLRNRLIADFDLKTFYSVDNDEDALSAFNDDFSSRQDKKTSKIIFSYSHPDPQLAADLCNKAVTVLQDRFNEIHQSASRRERAFLEERVSMAKRESDEVAERFAAFQREHKAVELESQTRLTVEVMGSLEGQLIAERVELGALLASSANSDNPQIKLLQQKISGLDGALAKLNDGAGEGEEPEGIFLRMKSLPELGAQYLSLLREVKRSEAMIVALCAQLETARLAEARNAEVITVLDPATPSRRRSSPQRSLIVFSFLIGALFTGLGIAWMKE